MSRQGVAPGAELARVIARLRASAWVRCEGVFSHLSASEVREPREAAGTGATAIQLERFAEALAQLPEGEVLPEWIHLANSSALDEGSTARWVRKQATAMSAAVLVRPGLAMYGYCLPARSAGEAEVDGANGTLRARLRPVATWKTRVIGLREIAPGDAVGYGATFVANQPMRLALLPVGYADGFRREASSGIGDGWVMIAGHRAPVVGRVSMNLTVVDVTGIAGVSVGDEVVLLGEGVSAEDHARWCGTIAYEILCGIRAERELGS
jgi:alanine racemase